MRGRTHRDGVLRLLEGFRGAASRSMRSASRRISAPEQRRVDRLRRAPGGRWRRFLDEVVGDGLRLLITEFDVNDKGLPADIAVRDRIVADYARAYLDLMLSYPQLGDILAWGMVDRYSWLQGRSPRADALPSGLAPMTRIQAQAAASRDRGGLAGRGPSHGRA